MNSKKQKRSTSSQYKGVSFHKQHNRWVSQIIRDKKIYNLGLFDSELEAVQMYNTKAKELFGEYAYLNEI